MKVRNIILILGGILLILASIVMEYRPSPPPKEGEVTWDIRSDGGHSDIPLISGALLVIVGSALSWRDAKERKASH